MKRNRFPFARVDALRIGMLLWVLAATAMAADGLAAGGPVPQDVADQGEQPEVKAADDRQLEAVVRQLEAPDFAQRERAMHQLLQAGAPAIGPLEQALARQGLETATRGIYILERFARRDDAQLQQQALAVLQRLAKTKDLAAHSYAAHALAEVAEFRRDRAVDLLRRRGAQFIHLASIGPEPAAFGKAAVELGDDWRGTDEDLRQLVWLTDIPVLCLTGPQFSDSSLRAVSEMQHLEWLKLKRCSVTSEGLAQLATLPNLHQIALNYMPLEDDIVDVIKTFPALDTVVLFGTRVSTHGAGQLVASNLNVHHRKGAFLGISFHEQCLVAMVNEGSAAERAGIEPGDQILALGGKPVENNEDLVEAIGMFEPGQKAELQLTRAAASGGESVLRVTVTFDEWP